MATTLKQREQSRAYKARNREKTLAGQKKYREENREKTNAACRAWNEVNQERCKANARAWRAANKEKARATQAAWTAANPGKVLAARKARLAKVAPEAVAEEYLRTLVEARGGMCPKFIDPARRGAPDRMVLLPNRPVYFIEMKRQKLGSVKKWQERYHEDLRRLGHKVSVLWSKEDVDAFFLEVDLTC